MKAFGGLMLVIGCILPVIGQIREEKTVIRRVKELSHALESLRRRLMTTAPDMEVLLRLTAEEASPEVGELFSSIHLNRLDEQPFSQQWAQAVKALFGTGDISDLAGEAGMILGQCPVEEQCRSLGRIAEGLDSLAEVRQRELHQRQKLWLTLSASVGGIMVILLA